MAWLSNVLSDCRIQLPRLYIQIQMNGNVQGLPTTVPMAEARIDAPILHASNPDNTKCSPGNGVIETAAPQAKPAAMA